MSQHTYTIVTTHRTYTLVGCTQARWSWGLFGPRRLTICNADDLILFQAPASSVVSVVQDAVIESAS